MTRYRNIFIFLFLLLPGQIAPASAQDVRHASKLTIGDRYILPSTIMPEDQPYSIVLPRSYKTDTSRSYPLLIVLDGYRDTLHTISGIAKKLARANTAQNNVPEMVIVGLPSQNRFRDYTPSKLDKSTFQDPPGWIDATGHSDQYRRFLKLELLPALEKQVRLNDVRVLLGHSLGGLLALSDLISDDPSFDGYIALDPSLWYDNRLLERTAQQMPPLKAPVRAGLYIALAATNDPVHHPSARNFDQLLKRSPDRLSRSRVAIFGNETHVSVELIGAIEGLKFIFAGETDPGL